MTTLLKFNPAQKNGINTLLDNFLKEVPVYTQENKNSPSVNITETREAFEMEINAPGRIKESFSINLDKNLLTVSYKPEATESKKEGRPIRKEFNTGTFSRSFTLDEKLISDGAIQAKYENGILFISLPKKEDVKQAARQIEIQ